jgi:UDP-2,3-diacylglucosamine pyrophosphatase LpxH
MPTLAEVSSVARIVHGVRPVSDRVEQANLLVVSDLHFGEELLPGAASERCEAVALGAEAFCAFLRYQTVRRVGGRPWRLVIAGDLFDFMSVVIPGGPALPAMNADERRHGVGRGTAAGVLRMAAILALHEPLLDSLVKFAAAGHQVDIIVGNHDVELLEPEVVAVLHDHLRKAGAEDKVLARIRVVPWFVYVKGVAWIEHGHVYDEGCSFEFNLAPNDPKDGRMIYNADYAAIRYLGMASPEIDPHGIEEWSFGGFMRYAAGQGWRPFLRLMTAYLRFMWSLMMANYMHKPVGRRRERRRLHRERLEASAFAGGLTTETAFAIDRLSRAPLTVSWRRLGRLLVLDKWLMIIGTLLVSLILLVAAPRWVFLLGMIACIVATVIAQIRLGKHMVTSQLPMRAVPRRLRDLVDAPVVVFGHTHDPRWQPILGGGLYVNCGTWLPALRPGLRRSFTHVLVQPMPGGKPLVELRQWRDGASLPFDDRADIGAGVTNPGMPRIAG